MYLNVVPKSSGMSGLGARRRGRVLVMRRRGIGQNTLAPGGLTQADCASAGEILDLNTGFCMLPNYGTPADIAAAAAAVNVQPAPPPVCVSTFTPSSNPNDWTQSYAANNTAASVCSQVNDQNGRLYQAYLNAITNWVVQGSQGTPPSPPSYVTFAQYWAPNAATLGPPPSSVSIAPAGTPIPQSGYDVSGGSTPVYSTPTPTAQPSQSGSSVSGSQQSAPPAQNPQQPITMLNGSGDNNPLAFASNPVNLFGSTFPIWEVAVGGLVAFLLLKKFL